MFKLTTETNVDCVRLSQIDRCNQFSGGCMYSNQPKKTYAKMKNLDTLHADMKNTEQMVGMSVLEHGESVWKYTQDILGHLRDGSELEYQWVIPDCVYEYKDQILDGLLDDSTIEKYTIYHDCGKPYCITFDGEGKRHFPNHAEVSYETFLEHFPDKPQVADLIRMDMDIHTMKAVDVPEFAARREAMTLIIVGLAEVHSNASMFGGTGSTSFKIKRKQIDKRAKAILKHLNS